MGVGWATWQPLLAYSHFLSEPRKLANVAKAKDLKRSANTYVLESRNLKFRALKENTAPALPSQFVSMEINFF